MNESTNSSIPGWRALVLVPLWFACAMHASTAAASTSADGSYREMHSLFEQYLDWRAPPVRRNGLVDYGTAAIQQRIAELSEFQARLERLDRRDWSRAQEVDYLAARSHLDRDEFTLRVTRPWQRDPVFYVNQMQEVAFTELPVRGRDLEQLGRQLRAVPVLVEEAKSNLADVANDFAYRAIYNLSQSDGVGAGHPYRATPPAGAVGWYDDLLDRARVHQPTLVRDIVAARDAVSSFLAWLQTNRSHFTAHNGVGEALLDWFLLNVEYVPYSSEEMLLLSQRELHRTRTFLALEQNKNRDLPELTLPTSAEEYHARVRKADERIRRWIDEKQILTLPPYMRSSWDKVSFIPYIERPDGPNFWEHVQFREPTPDHLTLIFPGHRSSLEVRTRDDLLMVRPELLGGNTIRSLNFGFRSEGWKLYLEEMSIPGGLLDTEPRVRELIYIFSLWRAVRSIGDIRNQRNEWTVPQTHEYWTTATPWMDERVAHRYSHLQSSPGHGVQYTIGAIEIQRLLGEMHHMQGSRFVLRDFHDTLLSRGRLPISLIRYELTGNDDDIRKFRDRTPLKDFLQSTSSRTMP